MPRHAEILDFWFGDGSDDRRRHKELWFAGSRSVDARIASEFLADIERAERGELAAWKDDADACLALVIVLDQLPPMAFRGQARGYRDGELALPVARHLVDAGYDRGYPPVRRMFAYLPFEHSETLADQERALALFAAMRDEPGMASAYDFAVRHWEIISRFGRFPHRNDALGRQSSAAEIEFLKQPGSRF